VPQGLAAPEHSEIEIGHAGRAHLARGDQLQHLGPGVLERSTRFVGPVELVQVDALDAKPP
jgi:hypothetical protein